jgi:hypothetical protein
LFGSVFGDGSQHVGRNNTLKRMVWSGNHQAFFPLGLCVQNHHNTSSWSRLRLYRRGFKYDLYCILIIA